MHSNRRYWKQSRREDGQAVLDLNITGRTEVDGGGAILYALFDRWEGVSDWALLVLVPKARVDKAVDVSFIATDPDGACAGTGSGTDDDASSDGQATAPLKPKAAAPGVDVPGQAVLCNAGTLDVSFVAQGSS